MALPMLTLVLGGAASGKSACAERLLPRETDEKSGGRRIYIATAQAWDDEMGTKIARHRLARGPDWDTADAPLHPGPALASARHGDRVLLDCATLWLSNHLLAGSDLASECTALLTSLSACRAPVVVVSNEVGSGIVPDNPLARRFREAQGALNQRLAAQAGLVVMVIAGLPLVLKGDLP